MADPLLDELFDWLRIPSISTGGGDPADLQRAAEWAAAKVRDAGGEAELVTIDGGNPLVVGELRASTGDDAPTVLIYGHYDVQGAEPLDLWTSPPFEPEIRDGRVFARGAADDKGNFLPLLHAACELAKAGELPVHVRVAVEGEEEAGGASISAWLAADERGADAAIVYDSGMAGPDLPAITVGLRGVVLLTFDVRAAQRDLHSGMYGGSALNSLHALHRALAQSSPTTTAASATSCASGSRRSPTPSARPGRACRRGDEALAAAGARPAYPGAGAEYVERNGSRDRGRRRPDRRRRRPHGDPGGHARDGVDPPRARPGPAGDGRRAGAACCAPGCRRAPSWRSSRRHSAQPALFPVDTPAIVLAAQALERACGVAPAFVRSGGSIPIVADFGAKGIPTIVTGFVLPDDPFHAPNESFSLRGLELGYKSARELLTGLADLKAE